MKRPSFTITIKEVNEREINYDANHISMIIVDSEMKVTFECSGSLKVVHPNDVKKIEYHPEGAEWCPWCDSNIAGISYKG